MKSAWKLCVFLSLATALLAQNSTPAKTPKKAKAAAITAADVQALKDAIAAQQSAIAQQQQQIQQLRDELHQKDQAVQQAQSTASDAASKASAAESEASQQQESITAVKNDVNDMKTNMTNAVSTLQEVQKTANEPPTAIHFKGITLTPGGFLAAEFVRRSRALGADINTPFNSLTVPGASASQISEFFGSGRQSRISMLAEGRLQSAKIGGYYEADFLSAGTTSNNNQSNSYTMRQRQLWGQAALDSGWTFTAGQMWSLITETGHGTDNRTESLPMTIDPNYHVGFSWARQYGLRLSKNFGNKLWFAVSMENAQATLTSHNNGPNFLVGSAGASGGLYNPLSNYSFNPSPDVVAKIVVEPGFGHYEVFGVYSRFRDRVFPCGEILSGATCGGLTTASTFGAFNSSKDGGGVGANARFAFANKRVVFGLHGFGGSGIGRFGSGGLPDVSVRGDGSLYLIKELQGLSTLEWHSSKLDVYLNAGAEYAGRAASYDPNNANLYVGYGSPFFSNVGCFSEPLPGSGGFAPGSPKSGTCTADTRVLIEGTAGFWYRLYNGPKGRLQWGPQYSYVVRNTWSGASAPNQPHGIDGMVFTSFRYYLP